MGELDGMEEEEEQALMRTTGEVIICMEDESGGCEIAR